MLLSCLSKLGFDVSRLANGRLPAKAEARRIQLISVLLR